MPALPDTWQTYEQAQGAAAAAEVAALESGKFAREAATITALAAAHAAAQSFNLVHSSRNLLDLHMLGLQDE